MDSVAAITDIVMVIPQAMGYALVAGLPPINGLYSALMGHCLYSPFGTSGQLIVAPVAIVSLMLSVHAFPSLFVVISDRAQSPYAFSLAFAVGQSPYIFPLSALYILHFLVNLQFEFGFLYVFGAN